MDMAEEEEYQPTAITHTPLLEEDMDLLTKVAEAGVTTHKNIKM